MINTERNCDDYMSQEEPTAIKTSKKLNNLRNVIVIQTPWNLSGIYNKVYFNQSIQFCLWLVQSIVAPKMIIQVIYLSWTSWMCCLGSWQRHKALVFFLKIGTLTTCIWMNDLSFEK